MAWIREPQEPYPQPPASSSPQSSLQLLNQLAEQCKKDALMRRTRRMSTATVLVAASHDVDRLRRRLPPLALSARVSGGHREEVVFAAAVRSPLTHQRAAAPMRLSHRTEPCGVTGKPAIHWRPAPPKVLSLSTSWDAATNTVVVDILLVRLISASFVHCSAI